MRSLFTSLAGLLLLAGCGFSPYAGHTLKVNLLGDTVQVVDGRVYDQTQTQVQDWTGIETCKAFVGTVATCTQTLLFEALERKGWKKQGFRETQDMLYGMLTEYTFTHP